MSDLTGPELPTESGWYMPTDEAPDGFWNPYYLHPDGSWMEAGFDGYTEVDPSDIHLPIGRLVFAAAATASTVELAEARVETSRWHDAAWTGMTVEARLREELDEARRKLSELAAAAETVEPVQAGDDYTPTTEQARNVYAYIGQGFAPSQRKLRATAEAEFDRWLAAELAAARHTGREEQQKADALIASQMMWPGRNELSQAAEAAGEEIAAAILAAEMVSGTV